MWQIWLIIVIILLISTYRYPRSFIFCFFIASIVSFLTSLFLNNLLLTCILFIVLASCLTFATHYFLQNFFLSKSSIPYNSNTLINQTGIVIKTITNNPLESGLVRINNETWPATSHSIIPSGSPIQVIAIQGLRLLVIPESPYNET